MPLKLDKVDMLILKSLLTDGRKSYRLIAKEVGITTPTVKSRVRRMLDAGIIKKFSPILDVERIEDHTSALISFKVDLGHLEKMALYLSEFDEVRNIFVTSGDSNLIIRLVTPDNKSLQEFLNKHIAGLKGVNVMSSQIIMKTVKDEQGIALSKEIYVSLRCDTCGQDIKGEPLILNVGEGKRFFCCKSCLSMYKEKYKYRIEKLGP